MGGTESKTTSAIVNEIAMDVAQESISRCIQSATQEQLIAIEGVSKDVVISGTKMRQGSSVNMQCVLSAEMQADIQSKIAQQIAQMAESKGIALLSALGRTKGEASTVIKQMFSASVKQSTVQETIMQTFQKQAITVANVGGKVVVKDTDMDQTLEMTAKAIISSSGYSKTISDIATAIDQSAATEETGPLDTLFSMIKGVASSWIFMILGIVVVGGLVFIFFMKYLFTTDTGAALVKSGTEIAQSQLGAGVAGMS